MGDDSGHAPSALAVIVAGGVGSRFGRSEGKQMVSLAGKPMLEHTVNVFRQARTIGAIVLVCHPDRLDEYREAVAASGGDTLVTVVPGGDTRQASVASGLRHMPDGFEIVAVHDGARPLVRPETVDAAVEMLAGADSVAGVVVGHPVFDTLKLVDDGLVGGSPDRSRYWVAQTPQVFWTAALLEAHARATTTGEQGTDDAMLIEAIGEKVMMCEGPRDNFKVTVEEDVALAEAVLRFRKRDGGGV